MIDSNEIRASRTGPRPISGPIQHHDFQDRLDCLGPSREGREPMLYIAIIASAVLLTAANVFVYWSKSRNLRPIVVGLCAIFLIVELFVGLVIPTVAVLAVLLLPLLFAWNWSRRGPAFFLSLSIGTALLVFGVAGVLSFRDLERLRTLYPYVSLEDRLPNSRPFAGDRTLVPESVARLSRLESSFRDGGIRVWRLRMLHEERVDLFINSFGFGSERMPRRPTESNMASDGRPVPLQPGPRFAFSTSPGEWMTLRVKDEMQLNHLHEQGILDFASSRESGYVKDRRHVAGFQSHRFRGVPESSMTWKVQTLDLVGLILDEEPRVYVSDQLPSMAEVRDVPTRPLDKFESVGLKTLQDGEDLWITREGRMARMLGAVRSTSQCIGCHGGARGDLLGAFTYTLRQERSGKGSTSDDEP
jgi:hypothetical protein